MTLTGTAQYLSAGARALTASEVRVRIDSPAPGSMVIDYTDPHMSDFQWRIRLRFAAVPGTTGTLRLKEITVSGSYNGITVPHGLSEDTGKVRSFDDVAAMLGSMLSFDGWTPGPVQSRQEAELSTSYGELTKCLLREGYINDMYLDGDRMTVYAYFPGESDRYGIDINLTFRATDPGTGDESVIGISLLAAEREVNDHAWEKRSIRQIPVAGIDTLDALLGMVTRETAPAASGSTALL